MSASSSTPSSTQPRKPNRPRFSFFVFLGVYPLVTALIYALAPFTAEWHIWQRNLVMVPMIVGSMVFVISLAIHKHCHRWR